MLFNPIKEKKYIKEFLEPSFFVKTMLILILLIEFPYVDVIAQGILKFTPFWAAIILFINVKSFRTIIKTDFFWMLILFCCSYVITIFLNRRFNIIQNTKSLIWFIIYIGILFVWLKYTKAGPEVIKRNIWQINLSIIIINLLNVIPSLILFISNICLVVQNRPLGIYNARLYGVIAGVNPSSMIAFVSIIAALMNMREKEKQKQSGFANCFYRVNIILSYIFIIASGTRSVRLILVAVAAFLGFVYLWKRLFLTNALKVKIISLAGSVIGGILIFISAYLLIEASRYMVGMLPMIGKSIGSINIYEISEKGDIDGDKSESILEKPEVRSKISEQMSTVHRIDIAKECVQLWRDYPIFGTGSANMYVYTEKSGETYQYINRGPWGASTHSMPLAVLLYSGLSGALLLSVYFVLKMTKSTLFILNNNIGEGYYGISILFPYIICLSLGIYSLAGTIIVFSNVECTILFWIYFGIMSEVEEWSVVKKN